MAGPPCTVDPIWSGMSLSLSSRISRCHVLCSQTTWLVGGTALDTALHALPFSASLVAQRMPQ
jgi:hypothetical protein